MTITRANTEVILIARVGAIMTEAGLDGSTIDGTNADLNDPIGWAIRRLGYSVVSIVLVADVDVASVGEAEYDEFFDYAEYRTLQNIRGNLALVDIRQGPQDLKYSQLAAQIGKMLDTMTADMKREYGFGLGELGTGTIIQEFQEQVET